MKQQIDSRVAEMHLKLTNMVLDEMDRQLDKIKFADLFFLMYEFSGSVRVEWDMQRKRPCVRVVVDDFQTQKPTINGEPVIAKMPIYSAKTNVQRQTGQPLAVNFYFPHMCSASFMDA
jgi:hypothetical protein